MAERPEGGLSWLQRIHRRSEKNLSRIVRIDETKSGAHLGEVVRGTVEEKLNAMLDAEPPTFAARLRQNT